MGENKIEAINGLVTKWGNEVFDDGVMNAPQCVARYGNRFMSGGEISFVMCLMSYKYDSRHPYPSQETLAKDMGVHVSQIGRWIDSLFNKKGLINIYERHLPDGTRTSNEYDFAPLLDKCLEESRKAKEKTEPEVKRTMRKRKTEEPKEQEKTEENIPHTNCIGHETYPIQNVEMDQHKMYRWNNTKCIDGSIQNVDTKKVSVNKEIVNKEIINNVCIEEQEILNLIESRDDLKKHTHKIKSILNKKKRNKSFKYDVFFKTLDIIDVDIKGIAYLETALMNNLKKGHVLDFANAQQKTTRKEIPLEDVQKDHVPTNATEEEKEKFELEKKKLFDRIKNYKEKSLG